MIMGSITEIKNNANRAYTSSNYADAISLYTSAIEASEREKIPDLLHVLYSNRSAAKLKLDDYTGALIDAESALSVQPSFVKALYRSAVACQHLSKHKEAREQLLKAAKLEPSNKEVAALLHQVEQTLAQDAIKRSSQPTSTSSPDAHPHLHASDTTPPTRSPTDPLIPPSCIPPAMRAGHMLQPSADGIDYNLLILLHGLGDKPGPFARLAQQLALPQTASMALPGPLVVPETGGGRAWLTAFDDEWELIQAKPGETRRTSSLATTTALLLQFLEQLTGKAGWQARQIHLFGFSQGGTAVLQLARQYKGRLGSVVAVSGSLLPEDADMIKAGSGAARSRQAAEAAVSAAGDAARSERTPVLITHGDRDDVVARGDVEASVAVLQAAGCDAALHSLPGKGHGIISGAAEAEALMKFWSQHLLARPADQGFMPVG